MAEQVIGKIGIEDVTLENAASEATLLLLLEAIEKCCDGGGRPGGRTGTPPIPPGSSGSSSSSSKDKDEKFRWMEQAGKDWNKMWQDVKSDFYNIIKTSLKNAFTGETLKNLFTEDTPTVQSFSAMFKDIPGVGKLISNFGEITQQNIDTFRQLSGAGIDLGDSIFSVKYAAETAGMSVADFKKTTIKHAETLAAFGGTASQGALRFADISNTLKKYDVGGSLSRLGYTMEEVADNTMAYMEIQRQSGRLQKMSVTEIAAKALQYNVQLDALARATGMQRKAIEEGLQSELRNTRSRLALSHYETATAATLTTIGKGLEATGREQLAAGLKEMWMDPRSLYDPKAIWVDQIAPGLREIMIKGYETGTDVSAELISAVNKMGEKSIGPGTEQLYKWLAYKGIMDRPDILRGQAVGVKYGDLKTASEERQDSLNKPGDKKKVGEIDYNLVQLQNKLITMTIPLLEGYATGLAGIVEWMNKFDPEKGFMENINNMLVEPLKGAWGWVSGHLEKTFKYIKEKWNEQSMPIQLLLGALGLWGVGSLAGRMFGGGGGDDGGGKGGKGGKGGGIGFLGNAGVLLMGIGAAFAGVGFGMDKLADALKKLETVDLDKADLLLNWILTGAAGIGIIGFLSAFADIGTIGKGALGILVGLGAFYAFTLILGPLIKNLSGLEMVDMDKVNTLFKWIFGGGVGIGVIAMISGLAAKAPTMAAGALVGMTAMIGGFKIFVDIIGTLISSLTGLEMVDMDKVNTLFKWIAGGAGAISLVGLITGLAVGSGAGAVVAGAAGVAIGGLIAAFKSVVFGVDQLITSLARLTDTNVSLMERFGGALKSIGAGLASFSFDSAKVSIFDTVKGWFGGKDSLTSTVDAMERMSQMGLGMNALATGMMKINKEGVNEWERLSKLGEGLMSVAKGLEAIGDVKTSKILEKAENIAQLATALENVKKNLMSLTDGQITSQLEAIVSAITGALAPFTGSPTVTEPIRLLTDINRGIQGVLVSINTGNVTEQDQLAELKKIAPTSSASGPVSPKL